MIRKKFTKMRGIVLALVFVVFASADNIEENVCYTHVENKCSEPVESWTTGGCNSIHGGFSGNSNNLHRIIVDDFTDSMAYLIMASSYNTDVKNHMGFHKLFMEKSDKMWARGKDMMQYVLQRGGKMGGGFQIPPVGASQMLLGLDYNDEIQGLGITLDLLKHRAEDTLIAYMHSYKTKSDGTDSSFDPATAHKLEELSEGYAEEIRDTAEKLNTLGRMVKTDSSKNLALHLFDQALLG
ncbi:uncharacterized protein LOC111708625 isoform X2 [Eurytemora carolleeae]|uniref:uncharacterized protein LOC111708625 isoform X2 n=1 Tax=Eurytemora carolleeae TaxID=1294199 RepID=UPI000C75E25B|nr:uncharacterized protein LOC111708625 isoform X2 [Eurytemora carolleeae]|eukprot:XP_023337830.1 uncharacterized protein LOC111708625 isoform X2 [Eurytemora affinis]